MAEPVVDIPYIVINDDDDDDDDNVGAQLRDMRRRVNGIINRQRQPYIELDDDQLADEELGIAEELREVMDLSDDAPDLRAHKAAAAEERQLGSCQTEDGLILREGMFVELETALPSPFSPQFFKIHHIVRAPNQEVILRGFPYARAKNLGGKLPLKLNEVCIISREYGGDKRPWHRQFIASVDPERVKRIRRLVTTNVAFPAHRFENLDYCHFGKQWVADNSPLVCRYRYVEYFTSRDANKPREYALLRILEGEADARFAEPDDLTLNKWRGTKVPGGSFPKGHVVDLCAPGPMTSPGQQRVVSPGQRYTAGDTFAGGGGASRGMVQAGVRLEFGVDNWDRAVESLELNFPATKIYNMDIHRFITNSSISPRTDMLHLSPPCQYWSPAHTVVGRNDDMNMAALYSCSHLINKVRPRVFTLEQTFGIMHNRFALNFNMFIQGFTEHGYSIRWKIAHLATYGLPQPRRRLIIIGAGPGETLPTFPAPTHSDGKDRLKPFVSVKQALAPARRPAARRHPLHMLPRSFSLAKPAWDPDTTLPRTITCSGGQNYHYSGKRDFTHLEYALLQGFPMNHQFSATYVKKQIGNAFPPSVVRIFYSHLVDWLDRRDNVVGRVKERVSELSGDEAGRPLVISDSDSDDVREVMSRRRKRSVISVSDSDEEWVSGRRASAPKRRRTSAKTSANVVDLVTSDDDDDDDDDAAACFSDADTETLCGESRYATPRRNPSTPATPLSWRSRGSSKSLRSRGRKGTAADPVLLYEGECVLVGERKRLVMG